MSSNKNDKRDFEESFGDELRGDAVDEELLAMAPPPPNLRFAVFTFSVFVLSIVMFVWFFPEFKYLLSGFGGPTPLGDAASLDVSTLDPDTYVSVEGLPRLTTTLEYSEGIRWFPGDDDICKFFPVVGQPNLFVQWSVPAEHKVYRDEGRNPTEPSPASFFQGRLVKRSELKKKNFKRIWVYFDCLKVHPASRCRYCLGRNSMEECRRAFTCVEARGGQDCGRLLERSEENLALEIQDVQGRIAKGVSLESSKRKLQQLKKLEQQLAEQKSAVLAIRLGEVSTRLAKIEDNVAGLPVDEAAQFNKLVDQVIDHRLKVLKVFARAPSRVLENMSSEQRRNAENYVEELATLRKDEKEHVAKMRILSEYVDIDDELRALRRRVRQIQKKLPLLAEDRQESLKGWKLDPFRATGKEILSQMSVLSEICFARLNRQMVDAGPPASDDDIAGSEKQVALSKGPIEEATRGPQAAHLSDIAAVLDHLGKRALTLERKLSTVEPGRVEALDKWVRTPDVLGGLPKGLKWDRIIGNFDNVEKMLAGIREPEATVPSVASRKNAAIDLWHKKRSRLEELSGMTGVGELQVLTPLWELEKTIRESSGDDQTLGELEMSFGEVRRGLLEKGFVPAELSRVPAVMAALEKTLTEADLERLEQQTEQFWQTNAKEDWVLFDGEAPIDRIWVVLIYLVLAVMVLINLRRLFLFWQAWRTS